ncbi:hypothetical protein DFQ07_2586 [Tenacibaculum caenipelagi]|uniref:Uncharacterized protein n=1 Tax=Tenacibaculum caenipelagi TaxID=1325435 RepID=A0A4R6TCB6_9FLAO|nr:hypothetical protein DFQ07_2586 [Tenacibaculum caenipelagi]
MNKKNLIMHILLIITYLTSNAQTWQNPSEK